VVQWAKEFVMKESGMWKNEQQSSPRSGSGKASQGKTHAGSAFGSGGKPPWSSGSGHSTCTPDKKSSGVGAMKRPSATAGLRGSAIRVGDNDADDKSSS
jgi:hypothetical protein